MICNYNLCVDLQKHMKGINKTKLPLHGGGGGGGAVIVGSEATRISGTFNSSLDFDLIGELQFAIESISLLDIGLLLFLLFT